VRFVSVETCAVEYANLSSYFIVQQNHTCDIGLRVKDGVGQNDNGEKE